MNNSKYILTIECMHNRDTPPVYMYSNWLIGLAWKAHKAISAMKETYSSTGNAVMLETLDDTSTGVHGWMLGDAWMPLVRIKGMINPAYLASK